MPVCGRVRLIAGVGGTWGGRTVEAVLVVLLRVGGWMWMDECN